MKFAIVVVLVIVAVFALLWFFQRKLIYFPSTEAVSLMPGATEVTLETSDGLRLAAWHVSPMGKDRQLSILVANGNGGDRSMRLPLAEALAAEGFSVLLFDYRGYGGNPGSPTEDGLALDVRAAYEYLKANRVIFFGESLGSAVVTELATEHPPAGLVLRSPFTSLTAMAPRPLGFLLRDRYPVSEHIAKVNVPTVIVYGTADSTVPPEQSKAVAAAAPMATTVAVSGADHNDYSLLAGPELIGAVVALADRIPT